MDQCDILWKWKALKIPDIGLESWYTPEAGQSIENVLLAFPAESKLPLVVFPKRYKEKNHLTYLDFFLTS